MSIITVVSVPEGIAMAADSRLTGLRKYSNGLTDRFAISDNSQKLFLLNKTKVGISSCGDAIMDGKTIADIIRLFEINEVEENDPVDKVAQKLIEYLEHNYKQYSVSFFISGYKGDEPHIYTIWSHQGQCNSRRTNINDKQEIIYNASWNGEYEAIEKLINGDRPTELNYYLMPLKDALDLSEFLVEVVIKYQRFEDRVATCGGPIDLLIITKDYARFNRHKVLT